MDDQLSPAMLAVLRMLAAGQQPDGRSWRAISALKRRGLVGGIAVSVITDAGRAALTPAPIDDEDDEPECEGHESLDGAHMGETVYCNGSCL